MPDVSEELPSVQSNRADVRNCFRCGSAFRPRVGGYSTVCERCLRHATEEPPRSPATARVCEDCRTRAGIRQFRIGSVRMSLCDPCYIHMTNQASELAASDLDVADGLRALRGRSIEPRRCSRCNNSISDQDYISYSDMCRDCWLVESQTPTPVRDAFTSTTTSNDSTQFQYVDPNSPNPEVYFQNYGKLNWKGFDDTDSERTGKEALKRITKSMKND